MRRYDAEEAYTEACSKALQARHPHAAWLVQHPAASLSDTVLLAATARLRAWLDDPERTTEQG